MNMPSLQELKSLAQDTGFPRVSIFMPTQPEGPEVRQEPIRFKNLVRQAHQELLRRGLSPLESDEFLLPTQQLLEDALFWQYQSRGLAVLISKSLAKYFSLPIPCERFAAVNDRFYIKPFLPLFEGDSPFYVAALSQDGVRLFEGTRFTLRPLDLGNVPKNLEDALKYDAYERHLEMHTSSSPARQGAPIFHGHGDVGTDDDKTNILRYFQQVDKGISQWLKDKPAPLVLMGVEYLLPIYREAHKYPHLMLEAITGNPETLNDRVLQARAWEIVRPHFEQKRERALERYTQLRGEGRLYSDDLAEILRAAAQGRVQTLFLSQADCRWGRFDPGSGETAFHPERRPDSEDLLDLAAIRTLLTRGDSHVLGRERIPGGAPAAATFRY